jgi:hypothetical protein
VSYAATTTVPIERSRAEIERLLLAKGASKFMSAFDQAQGKAIIGWTMEGRMVRLLIPLPDPAAREFTERFYRGRPTYTKLSLEAARVKWEQACRTRWRAILLILKAKFEAVEAGISSVEREFLADTLLANGQTVGHWLAPQLESMYANGRMPALLPGLGETGR